MCVVLSRAYGIGTGNNDAWKKVHLYCLVLKCNFLSFFMFMGCNPVTPFAMAWLDLTPLCLNLARSLGAEISLQATNRHSSLVVARFSVFFGLRTRTTCLNKQAEWIASFCSEQYSIKIPQNFVDFLDPSPRIYVNKHPKRLNHVN